jgi:hypothetical protein
MDDLEKLEGITTELMEVFEVYSPPVPIETMLNKPRENMWDEVDATQLSGGFMSIKDRYSPRMSLARLLARHIASSDWGRERGLFEMFKTDETLLPVFARMLIMPANMLRNLSAAARNPTTMSLQFEVPEEDARQRLQEYL